MSESSEFRFERITYIMLRYLIPCLNTEKMITIHKDLYENFSNAVNVIFNMINRHDKIGR